VHVQARFLTAPAGLLTRFLTAQAGLLTRFHDPERPRPVLNRADRL